MNLAGQLDVELISFATSLSHSFPPPILAHMIFKKMLIDYVVRSAILKSAGMLDLYYLLHIPNLKNNNNPNLHTPKESNFMRKENNSFSCSLPLLTEQNGRALYNILLCMF